MKKIVAIVIALCMCIGAFAPSTYKASEDFMFGNYCISSFNLLEYGEYVTKRYVEDVGNADIFWVDLSRLDHVDDNCLMMFDYHISLPAKQDVKFTANIQLSSSYEYFDTDAFDDVIVKGYRDGKWEYIISTVTSRFTREQDVFLELDFMTSYEYERITIHLYCDLYHAFSIPVGTSGSNIMFGFGYDNEFSISPHIFTENVVEKQEEQLVLTNNIFENIKIIGQYISSLPSKIASSISSFFTNLGNSFGGFITGLGDRISGFFTTLSSNISGYFTNLGNNIGGFFTTLSNNIGGYFTNLGNQIGGYFNNLARDIAVAIAEVFGWDDYQEGDSGLNDIFDKVVGSLPDLSAYVPRPGTLLGDVFGILFSNDTVAVFLKIVTVVGVGSFLIFK